MKQSLRQSMTWLHTWSGLLVGWVLYFIFVTGTLGYFYVEIDRWMRPELPLASAALPLEASAAKVDAFLRAEAADAGYWRISLPAGRQLRQLDAIWGNGDTAYGGVVGERPYAPADDLFAEPVEPRATQGGYGLYRMHWKLHYLPQMLGVFIVGFCTMAMLVALITGVIAHKRIFADFFTFRPRKGQRSWLDVHNLMGVLSLPFLIMITYSGLVFYTVTYVPSGLDAAFGSDPDGYWRQIEPNLDIPAPGAPAAMRPLAGFVRAATTQWDGHPPDMLIVLNPLRDNARVVAFHSGQGTVLRDVGERLVFDGPSGALSGRETAGRSGPHATYSALLGLHEGVFADTLLRWLYFASGLLGCAMVATGLVLWTVKRRAKRGPSGEEGFGHRLVECLNIGTIAGLPVAVAAYFWANRLLPAAFAERQPWEFHALFAVWGLMLVYPAFRPGRRAWAEELGLAAAAIGLLPLVNLLTTDRHLGVTVPAGDWALAGFDLTALALALGFAAAARLAARNPAPIPRRRRDKDAAIPAASR
ncbi:MAG: PepSY-associated TM helix domain-containing protein [Phenylobacterium sp.]|nr:PepSY-associated TM helix domain-containing protein [Phenylobacterium sp.]